MSDLRVGLGLPLAGAWATPDNLRRVATGADELGYASLWTFQRLVHPIDDDWGPTYHAVHDPIAALSYTAGITSQIRLGLAVVNLPWYAPIVLAKALTTLDTLSDGRLNVGLGLGWAPQEFAAVGTPSTRRGARGEEFVACLKQIWTEPEPEFHGSFYDLPRVRVDPKPVQRPHPPLLLGGMAEVALRRAGRIADGWISSSRTDLTTIEASIDVVRSAAASAGRDPATLRFVVRGVVRLTPDEVGDRKPLQGTADEIRSDLDALAAKGVTEVFLDLNYDPRMVSGELDPAAALDHAETVLHEFAPSS
ncbi:MAG TPA: TIGR03619 family F420-dependent LLM class oxidoreductase [Nocardioidaceae bacterium]|nr:TIGR03619 family F420-dependent LLM class oxidoreductase [Nocardioidaceae bacterium]